MNDYVAHATPEFTADDTEGTVRVCGCCGRGWVLTRKFRQYTYGHQEEVVVVETRGERRCRERAQRRLAVK